jgi:hypothetical protein
LFDDCTLKLSEVMLSPLYDSKLFIASVGFLILLLAFDFFVVATSLPYFSTSTILFLPFGD